MVRWTYIHCCCFFIVCFLYSIFSVILLFMFYRTNSCFCLFVYSVYTCCIFLLWLFLPICVFRVYMLYICVKAVFAYLCIPCIHVVYLCYGCFYLFVYSVYTCCIFLLWLFLPICIFRVYMLYICVMVVFAYMLSWRGWHRGGWLDLLVNVYNNNNSLLESAYCSPVMVHCATFLLNFQGYMLLKISYSQQKSQQYMYGFLVQISGRIVESAECPLSLSTHSWIFSMFYIPHSLSLLSSFLLIIILLFLPLILLYYLSFLSSSLFPFLFSSFLAFFIIW